MEKEEFKINEKQFLEIRNSLSVLSVSGVQAVLISSDMYEEIQKRIEWGFGERSDYLCNVQLVKL